MAATKSESRQPHDRAWIPLGLVVLLIALATLVPLGHAPPSFDSKLEIPDALVNLVLYFPLGFLLRRRGWRIGWILALAAGASTAIELLQGTLIAGRRGSAADVMVNLAGAAFGAWGFGLASRVAASSSPRVRAGLLTALSLPVVFWLGSGWLLAPRPRATPRYYSLWAHEFVGTEKFRGTLLSVRLQGQEVPDGIIPDAGALRSGALREGLRLEVSLRSDGPTFAITHLASIGDLEDGSVVGVDQVGEDLMLYWWSRGSARRLRAPRITFAGAARASRGELLELSALITPARATLNVTRAGKTRSWSRRLGPWTGWRNLIPSRELSGPEQGRFDLVWSLALALYLMVAARVVRTRRI